MGILDSLYPPKPIFLQKSKKTHLSSHIISSKFHIFTAKRTNHITQRPPIFTHFQQSPKAISVLIGAVGITLISIVGPSYASESSFLNEPSNALSLPTWAIHVSSVAEWVTAMALVWQYGEKSGFESWKGLSWGMVNYASLSCTFHGVCVRTFMR